MDEAPKPNIVFLTNIMDTGVVHVVSKLGDRRPITKLWMSQRGNALSRAGQSATSGLDAFFRNSAEDCQGPG